YQKNTFLTWQFAINPTAFLSYKDTSNIPQLIMGDANGQCYTLDRTKTSDNGTAIPTEMIFLFSYAAQQEQFSQTSASQISGMSYQKKWNWWRGFFNPGCEVNVQFGFSDTLNLRHVRWTEAYNTKQSTGDYWQVSDGVVEMRFPMTELNPPRSRFLFLRIYDNSDNSAWTFNGCAIDAEIMIIR
ncbi:MAG: hypothetical protein KGI08_11065, partial [Thaumarchaeota archaeon]|nr:hypothetical protein [Nitrososphaerota archaeon]